MKQLSSYQLNDEVSYIKRFVIGVTPKELEEIFGIIKEIKGENKIVTR